MNEVPSLADTSGTSRQFVACDGEINRIITRKALVRRLAACSNLFQVRRLSPVRVDTRSVLIRPTPSHERSTGES